MNLAETKTWWEEATHASAFHSFESCCVTTDHIDWLIAEVDRLTEENDRLKELRAERPNLLKALHSAEYKLEKYPPIPDSIAMAFDDSREA